MKSQVQEAQLEQGKKSNIRKWLLWFVLIDFTVFSVWVMWDIGYMGIWQAGFTDSGSLQILLDLAICCMIFISWMIGDAKARGVNPAPWIVATLAMGSIAPLAYLLVREYQMEAGEAQPSQVLKSA